MSNAVEFTNETFASEVEEGSIPVLVDFFAEWCGPCQMMGPVIDEVAAELGDKVKVGKVDCDKSGEIASKFGISSIPCLILFKDGKEVDRNLGFVPKETLTSWIESKI
jgi:thioredoxin 1